MKDFLTTTKTVAPPISILWYAVMIALVFLSIWSSLKYHDNPRFVKAFKWIQIAQLLMLYSWYFGFRIPFSNSLPFYHCRLAMFAVVFLPDKWRSKQYFALLGASGAVFALGYPVFDPYDFPHITSFSFLIGHYALLVNSLIYLVRFYDSSLLKNREIVLYTFVLDLFLVGVNQVTGGNYGLMARPPIIKGDSLLVNYVVVSSILAAALLLFNVFFSRRPVRKRVSR